MNKNTKQQTYPPFCPIHKYEPTPKNKPDQKIYNIFIEIEKMLCRRRAVQTCNKCQTENTDKMVKP